MPKVLLFLLKPIPFSAVMVVSTLPSNSVFAIDNLEDSFTADDITESIEEVMLREPKCF